LDVAFPYREEEASYLALYVEGEEHSLQIQRVDALSGNRQGVGSIYGDVQDWQAVLSGSLSANGEEWLWVSACICDNQDRLRKKRVSRPRLKKTRLKLARVKATLVE